MKKTTKIKIGIANTKYCFDKKEIMHLHFVQGKTLSEIGQIYNCNQDTISRFFKKNDLKPLSNRIHNIKNIYLLNIDDLNIPPFLEKNIKAKDVKWIGGLYPWDIRNVLNIINMNIETYVSIQSIAKMYDSSSDIIRNLIQYNGIKINKFYKKNGCSNRSKSKRCIECKKIKLFTEFPKLKKTRVGVCYRNKCKKCFYKKQMEYNKHDISHRIRKNLKERIKKILKGEYKNISTYELLKCSKSEFKKYFESLFTQGMTWKKYFDGDIHIDHIVPLSYFNLADDRELQYACNYQNLQPLWAKDNLKKHNTIDKNDWRVSRVLQWLSYYHVSMGIISHYNRKGKIIPER